jgi:hypothetical protein
MNWARGLFRLWLVGAALYVPVIAFLGYPEVMNNFDRSVRVYVNKNKLEMVPVPCGDVRGEAGTDYTTKWGQEPGPWDKYAKVTHYDKCWYSISNFRALYPEYADLSDRDLLSKTYKTAGAELDPDRKPWTTLFFWLGVALGIPLLILVLGKALFWAIVGFSPSSDHIPR